MAKPATPEAAKSLTKLDPLAIGSAAVTLIATALYIAPSVGIKVPDKIARFANVAMTFAAVLGIKPLVKAI